MLLTNLVYGVDGLVDAHVAGRAHGTAPTVDAEEGVGGMGVVGRVGRNGRVDRNIHIGGTSNGGIFRASALHVVANTLLAAIGDLVDRDLACVDIVASMDRSAATPYRRLVTGYCNRWITLTPALVINQCIDRSLDRLAVDFLVRLHLLREDAEACVGHGRAWRA